MRAIHAQKSLHVVVTNKQVGKWLVILQERYGKENVDVEEISLKRQLGKQIGMSVPEYVTDLQIKESGLLDLSIPASANISFEE